MYSLVQGMPRPSEWKKRSHKSFSVSSHMMSQFSWKAFLGRQFYEHHMLLAFTDCCPVLFCLVSIVMLLLVAKFYRNHPKQSSLPVWTTCVYDDDFAYLVLEWVLTHSSFFTLLFGSLDKVTKRNFTYYAPHPFFNVLLPL